MAKNKTVKFFLLVALALFSGRGLAAESDSIALYGSPKYGGGWQHFDYADPDARKGGRVVLPAYGTFDNFNPFIFKGIAATQVAALTMDSLAVVPDDDITTAYPLIAKKFELTDEYVGFILDERARFADGSEITADDVIFSYRSLVEKGSPVYKIYYADVERAEKLNSRHVRFYFKKGSNNKELPLILSQMLIYSAKDWEGKDFAKPYLKAPLGSGPYVLADFQTNKYLVFRRNPDYWVASISVSLSLKYLLDDFIIPLIGQKSPNYAELYQALMVLGTIFLIGVIATFTYTRMMVYIGQGVLKKVRDDMFEHMQTLPIRYFDQNTNGSIMSLYTNDTDTLRQMISQSMPQMFNSAMTIVSVFACMVALSIPLTLLTLIMIGVITLGSKKLTSLSGKYFIAQQKNIGAVNGYIEEMMEGQKVVKVFCHEEKSMEEFNKLNDHLFESANNANKFANVMGPFNAQVGNVSYVLCACIGAIIAIKGIAGFTMTPGSLISFLTYNKQFAQPINQITMQMNSIVMAIAGGERIFKLLDEKPEVDDGYVTLVRAKKVDGNIVECENRTGMWAWKHYHKDTDTTTYVEMKGEIVFNGVDFGYTDDKIVLHDVKLYANPGEKLAFVGSTGAGKTTITNLINRFYDIQDGKIRYDGININKIKKADLRRSLGIVLQETNLFSATVMENIRYGKLDATDEEVIAAAKLANADSFIRRLPDGYNTMLTGNGGNLSQGQRQLLSIARAAVANPPALILDEATSSIDTRTERLVQEGMDALMKGRTTFVIAHRLSTIRNSDCIMVLEQGRIIERGNHDDLMKQKGTYYRLQTGSSPN